MFRNVAVIYFGSDEGASSVSFDTHDVAELLELFHTYLLENNLSLKEVDWVEFTEEKIA